jgi:MoxR-like ATPase
MALLRAAQALAALRGYDFVLPDHVKEVAPWVLTHRLVVHPEKRLRKVTAAGVLAEVIQQVEVPRLAMAAA